MKHGKQADQQARRVCGVEGTERQAHGREVEDGSGFGALAARDVEAQEVVALSREDLGRRIEQAREAAGLSQTELAQIVDLSQSAISRIESGSRGVDSLELAGIADALRVSVVDLLEARPLAQRLRVAARQQEAESPVVESAINRVADVLRLWELLESQQHQPDHSAFDLPHRGLEINKGRALAKQARRLWGLGDDPLPDLFTVIEERAGLPLLLEPLGAGLDGLLVRTDDIAVALVDSSTFFGRQRFTAAHELCHFLMDDGDLLVIDEDIFAGGSAAEMRANAFAAHFLMPIDGIRRYIRDRRPLDESVIAELQVVFGVSLESLLWQLFNNGEIDDDQRRRFNEIGAKTLAFRAGYGDEWEAAEERRDVRRPPRALFLDALSAYAEGRLGIEPVANLAGRNDPETLRQELESHGIGRDERWWESTAPA